MKLTLALLLSCFSLTASSITSSFGQLDGSLLEKSVGIDIRLDTGQSLTWHPPRPPDGRSESRRIGLWWQSPTPQPPSALIASFRHMAREGGTVYGWCPDGISDLPDQQGTVKSELGTNAWLED